MSVVEGEARARLVAECRAVLAHHARTFDLAGLFLPADRLDDAAIVYAFCRLVDDTIDEASEREDGVAALRTIEAELDGEAPARPLIAGVKSLAEARGIDPGVFRELCVGVRGDADGVRITDDDELVRYCYRVAGTVGLMMCGVMGVTEAEAGPFALDLGIAMQITNICRDVAEDAGRGRVYLPATRLVAAGVAPESIIMGRFDRRALSRVVADLLALAERYYASAERGMGFIPGRSRLAILVASRVYRAIGLRLGRRGADPMTGRTVVPGRVKAGWVAAAVASFVAGAARRRRRAAVHDPWLHRSLGGLPGADPRALRLRGRLVAA